LSLEDRKKERVTASDAIIQENYGRIAYVGVNAISTRVNSLPHGRRSLLHKGHKKLLLSWIIHVMAINVLFDSPS
jgi:hypothetical protein